MPELIDQLLLVISDTEPTFIAMGAVILPLWVSYHILMTKKDVHAAVGWMGLVWLVPFLGAFFYFLLGINRIQRKAVKARTLKDTKNSQAHDNDSLDQVSELQQLLPPNFLSHIALVDRTGRMPFTSGNDIQPLMGMDEAFSAMLKAIQNAKRTIVLASYIFGNDDVGKAFADHLIVAAKRGVKIRVLIDGVGAFYNWPWTLNKLRKAGVQVVRFNKSFLPWKMAYFNLRNHRKILIIDGELGFTGGINLRAGQPNKIIRTAPMRDFHFQLKGPIVGQMMDVFIEDWHFSTNEKIARKNFFTTKTKSLVQSTKTKENKQKLARGLPDGPDEDFDKMAWVLQSILSASSKSIRIVTPYFLPDRILVRALNYAAFKGVDVEIYVPQKNNLPFVAWAAQAQYDQLLKSGCKIFETAPPFDHSKLMVVDECWVLFGSTNWDPRSLRLNFEFNVECFDEKLAKQMQAYIEGLRAKSNKITAIKIASTSVFKKLRNGLAWLFSPYL